MSRKYRPTLYVDCAITENVRARGTHRSPMAEGSIQKAATTLRRSLVGQWERPPLAQPKVDAKRGKMKQKQIYLGLTNKKKGAK